VHLAATGTHQFWVNLLPGAVRGIANDLNVALNKLCTMIASKADSVDQLRLDLVAWVLSLSSKYPNNQKQQNQCEKFKQFLEARFDGSMREMLNKHGKWNNDNSSTDSTFDLQSVKELLESLVDLCASMRIIDGDCLKYMTTNSNVDTSAVEQFKECHEVPEILLRYGGTKALAALLQNNAESYQQANVQYVEFSYAGSQLIKFGDVIAKTCHEIFVSKRIVFRFLAAFNRSMGKLQPKDLELLYNMDYDALYQFIVNGQLPINNKKTSKILKTLQTQYNNAANNLLKASNDIQKYIVGFDLHGLEDYGRHHPFVPFTPAFDSVIKVAYGFQNANPNFGFRIHLGEISPSKFRDMPRDSSYKNWKLGLYCGWLALRYLCNDLPGGIRNTWPVRIGHGLVLPYFLKELCNDGYIAGAIKSGLMPKDNRDMIKALEHSILPILTQENLFLEICPLSNFYLHSNAVEYELHDLIKYDGLKIVVGTDDPAFFSIPAGMHGEKLNLQSANMFDRVLEVLEKLVKVSSDEIRGYLNNVLQAMFCSDNDRNNLLNLQLRKKSNNNDNFVQMMEEYTQAQELRAQPLPNVGNIDLHSSIKKLDKNLQKSIGEVNTNLKRVFIILPILALIAFGICKK
jgi:adenosine deaminase